MIKKKITEKYRQGAGYHTFVWTKDIELEKLRRENEMVLSKPTYRQELLINDIENLLHIKFEGKNKKEAYNFISQNIEKFKEVKNNNITS